MIQEHAVAKTDNSESQVALVRPVNARLVARALCDFLEKAETSVHWVNVSQESSLDVVPKVTWPEAGDPMFNIMIQHGHSEGMLLHVMAQANRYKPDEAKPILLVKMLGGPKGVCAEIPLILKFLDNIEETLKNIRANDIKESSASPTKPSTRARSAKP